MNNAATISLAGILAMSSFLATGVVLGSDDAGQQKTRIVLIAGKPSHPSGQHEFNAGAILLARALNQQSSLDVHVHVVHNGWPNDESVFEGAKAIVIYSDGNQKHPTMGHEATLDAMIDKGVGLMCMHYGVEVPPGPRGEYFKKWIGGHYEAGFSCNPHWTAMVTPRVQHPISQGVSVFPANDEWYYNMRFADSKVTGVLNAKPSRERINRYVHWTPAGKKTLGTTQALMWSIQRSDGGRGVGFTGGHWHRNWAIDNFRTAVLNAIVWTAKMDVPKGGVRSKPITESQLNENLDVKKAMLHIGLPNPKDLTQPQAAAIDFRWPNMPKK